jgi:GNAT superfamily N-acetyltransferase
VSAVFTHRTAAPDDDLTRLWPEAEAEAHTFNREQVLLITQEAGRILGGALVYHGGHSICYVGAVKIVDDDLGHPPQWIARALWRYVRQWCGERGVTVIGHGASTEACMDAMERLGGRPVRIQTLYEVPAA